MQTICLRQGRTIVLSLSLLLAGASPSPANAAISRSLAGSSPVAVPFAPAGVARRVPQLSLSPMSAGILPLPPGIQVQATPRPQARMRSADDIMVGDSDLAAAGGTTGPARKGLEALERAVHASPGNPITLERGLGQVYDNSDHPPKRAAASGEWPSLPQDWQRPALAHSELRGRYFRRAVVSSAIALARSAPGFQSVGTQLGAGWAKSRSRKRPAEAVRGIFANALNYSFDCGPPIMLIYYGAVLQAVGERLFNQIFSGPDFFHFPNPHRELHQLFRSKLTMRLIPGYHYYFNNPDYIDPAFRGENAIYLGRWGGQPVFYAHGIDGRYGRSLATEEEILRKLRAAQAPGARRRPFRDRLAVFLDDSKLPN